MLWALLLLQPPFPALVVIIGLIGFHAVGASPVLGMALSEVYAEGFSRAFGLANLVALPITMLAVPATAFIYAHTGSYAGVIGAEVGFLAVMLPAVFAAGRKLKLRPAE